MDGQNCQLTSGEVNQSLGIIETYADDVEHRCTPSPKDVGLCKELLHEKITYWIEREALLKFSVVVDHVPIPSKCTKSNPSFAQKFCFIQRKSMVKHRVESGLYILCKRPGILLCLQTFSKLCTSSAFASDGFDDWHNSYLIQTHENSEKHRNAMLTYLTRKRGHTLTLLLEEQMKAEQQNWLHVMKRISAVICALAKRGLPFRGENEQFVSPSNGNCLDLLELVAKFDIFLLSLINQESGNPSYLLKTICKELLYFYELCNFGTPMSSSVNLITTYLPHKGGGFPLSKF